jgi:NAD(P)-dependent dehydrogenase (short-subunit alcohol dehydrogenase family)
MILDEFKMKGEVVLLTCTGRSMLKGLIAAITEAGATVSVAGPDAEEIDLVVKDAREKGGDVFSFPTDLTRDEDTRLMVERVLTQFGKIDCLVNNLNMEFAKPFLEVTAEEWEKVMSCNLNSVFHCIQAVGKYMIEKNSGRVVNITSGLAQRGMINGSVYCAGMGGVLQMTRSLALEWADKNVRVNAVGTGWLDDAFSEDPKDSMARYIPMRRRAKPDDILPMVLFLASEASSYMTGYIYFADGGLMARG